MECDIAVIGMDCKFPSAKDPWELWQLITSNRTAIQNISTLSDEEDRKNPHYVPYKGIIDSPFHFDADFFGISPGEAKLIDPQHRLFFQTAYRAIESAGYNPRKLNATTGVFACCGFPGYLTHHLLNNRTIKGEFDSLTLQVMNDKDFMATRLAYLLNLTGPAMTLQSACSSSLLAIHTACQFLITGECDLALAGGVSFSFPIYRGHIYQEGSIGSKDGNIYAFDHRASGTVRGDGVGVVLLKPLKQAIADLDPIIAVIKGSSTNNDGRNKVSFTAPGVPQQSAAIRDAMRKARVTAEEIDLIETHGTGTKLGDPIEVRAIHDVFKNKSTPLTLSSIKPHIGHLDAASGVAGFIKLCLAIHNKSLPHTLNFDVFNPLILPYTDTVRILKESTPWHSSSQFTAGITSLGMGGANVHMILQGYPQSPERRQIVNGHVFSGQEYVIYPDERNTSIKVKEPIDTFVKNSWKKILSCRDLLPEDNFFDLGGNSFLAIQCLSQLPKELKNEVSVLDLFQYPTLEEFINHLKSIEISHHAH